MAEKCLLDPQRDCYGLLKAGEVDQRLSEVERRQAEVNERLQDRLGEVEKRDSAQVEQYNHILERLGTLSDRNADSLSRAFGRLEELEKQGVRQGEQYKSISDTLTTLSGKLDLLSGRIGTMEMKPAKRWESMVGQVIGLLVAAIVGLLLGRLGLG